MNYKKWFKISVAINGIFAVLIIIFLLHRIGIGELIKGHNYLDNDQYSAYLSMFELNNSNSEIVFAGDSLTCRCHFDELIDSNSTILNRGIGSDTTEGLYNRMDEILSHNPSKLFIMVGINDIAYDIPLEETLMCYENILKKTKRENPDTTVYVQSVLPCLSSLNNSVPLLNSELKKLSTIYGCRYVDVNALFLKNGKVDKSLYSEDGIHLNGNGYKIWMDYISQLI